MAHIDPHLLPMLRDLTKGLAANNVRFHLIGGLVPELQLNAAPPRLTNDADVVVTTESLSAFAEIKTMLGSFGFATTSLPYRLMHDSGGRVDLLPFGAQLLQNGKLILDADHQFNMAGFRHADESRVDVTIAPDLIVPAVSLPLFIIMKLVAFTDRKEPKDLASALHVLRHYRPDDDAAYGLEHNDQLVPWEFASAFLAGEDGRPYVDADVQSACSPLLDSIDDVTTGIAIRVAREQGVLVADDRHIDEIRERFSWYRLGARL